LADCYALLASIELGVLAPVEAMPKAKAAARRAAELDPSLAEAHASLGYAALWFDWDWTGAQQELSRAIELNPAYPTARQW
jgi:tetratricopeptide (TPR) repeat protein